MKRKIYNNPLCCELHAQFQSPQLKQRALKQHFKTSEELPADHYDNEDSGLAQMSIHYEKPVDYDAVVQRFAEQQPRRMLLVGPIF